MISNNSIFIIVVAGLLCSYIVVKNVRAPQRDAQSLVVGTVADYAPFVSVNAQGEYEGFDIDVANALAKKMGKQLILNDLGSMSALFIALEQGSIDAIIWGLSITQDRIKKIAMIRYHGEMTLSYPFYFGKKFLKESNLLMI